MYILQSLQNHFNHQPHSHPLLPFSLTSPLLVPPPKKMTTTLNLPPNTTPSFTSLSLSFPLPPQHPHPPRTIIPLRRLMIHKSSIIFSFRSHVTIVLEAPFYSPSPHSMTCDIGRAFLDYVSYLWGSVGQWMLLSLSFGLFYLFDGFLFEQSSIFFFHFSFVFVDLSPSFFFYFSLVFFGGGSCCYWFITNNSENMTQDHQLGQEIPSQAFGF